MKVFSKAKFLESKSGKLYKNWSTRAWVDSCDGKKVVNNRIVGTPFRADKAWCIEVNDAPDKYEITIRSDGKTTRAEMIINGKTIKTSKARCNPSDKFNFAVGARLAFDRLFLKRKNLYHLNIGDKVRVRNDLEVDKVYGADVFVEDMQPYRGKIVTIDYVVAEGLYKIEEDEACYTFTAEMFEG